MNRCRVCAYEFFQRPLLRFENMPRAAQFMPDEASVGSETGCDLEIFQCAGCGLVQLGGGPVPYYREVVRAAAISQEMTAFREAQFSSFVRRFSLKGRRIVEIGCGRGEYLSILQRTGVHAYGLEYSERSLGECVSGGLEVSRGFLESPDDRLDHAPFQAFFILSFLEHVPDPNALLGGVRNNLADDGVGIVEVPNFDMILRKRLFSEFIGDHLFYFTADTLAATLSRCGFEVIECAAVWHDYILSAVVRRRSPLDLTDFFGQQARIKSNVDQYVNRIKAERGKLAVWGAGHQALAVISLLGLADRIEYVVDSAKFKQGRFTPATHLRIVAPDALEDDPVDAVIVMSASYSDEVAALIRQRFGDGIRVAILRDNGLEIQ